MNWDRANQWLQMIANLGVVAGFLLLAVQMNQNTEAIRQQNFGNLVGGLTNAELAGVGDSGFAAYSTAMFRPAELTEQQFIQLVWYLDVFLGAAHNTYEAHRSGYATSADWDQAKHWAALAFSFDVGREMWDRLDFGIPREMRDEIDAEIKGLDDARLQNSLRATFARIEARFGATAPVGGLRISDDPGPSAAASTRP